MSTPGADDEQRRSEGLPPSPREPGPHHEPVYAPAPVNVSCWLWAAAGLLLVAGLVLTLSQQDAIVAGFVERSQDRDVSVRRIAEGVSTAVWGLLIGAVAYAGLIGLFAYKAREGTRSARNVLTALTVVLVLAQFVLFANVLTWASALVGVAALVLMHLPSVAAHYPRVPKKLP